MNKPTKQEKTKNDDDSASPHQQLVMRDGESVTLNELFDIIQASERAFKKMGLRGKGNDYSLPSEVRMIALALEHDDFKKAKAFIKELHKSK